ncbi:MAG: hypothetical protein Unbinned3891contig1000_54 [Prokaryotic dsDNA virus sp.]|nr:MAG: hypothetical protein Unbinned3891contig1000_54 [Prokaryotic dsDNA virus sp.]|tara:strand:- start:63213 stop:63476 length:264 start_codon:yes stop_codon:yes gene_type:complete
MKIKKQKSGLLQRVMSKPLTAKQTLSKRNLDVWMARTYTEPDMGTNGKGNRVRICHQCMLAKHNLRRRRNAQNRMARASRKINRQRT